MTTKHKLFPDEAMFIDEFSELPADGLCRVTGELEKEAKSFGLLLKWESREQFLEAWRNARTSKACIARRKEFLLDKLSSLTVDDKDRQYLLGAIEKDYRSLLEAVDKGGRSLFGLVRKQETLPLDKLGLSVSSQVLEFIQKIEGEMTVSWEMERMLRCKTFPFIQDLKTELDKLKGPNGEEIFSILTLATPTVPSIEVFDCIAQIGKRFYGNNKSFSSHMLVSRLLAIRLPFYLWPFGKGTCMMLWWLDTFSALVEVWTRKKTSRARRAWKALVASQDGDETKAWQLMEAFHLILARATEELKPLFEQADREFAWLKENIEAKYDFLDRVGVYADQYLASKTEKMS